MDDDVYEIEIDLSPLNLARSRQAVQPFTAAARRVGGEQQPPTGKAEVDEAIAAGAS